MSEFYHSLLTSDTWLRVAADAVGVIIGILDINIRLKAQLPL